MSATSDQLKAVRKRLDRGMTPCFGGFRYQSVYGCEPGTEFLNPHILVRVELRHVEGNWDCSKFFVWVDYHLPLGADVESAELFKKAVLSATKKAKWAQGVVNGLEWHRKIIMAAEVE